MRLLTVASLLTVLTTGPALAWQVGVQNSDIEEWVSAYEDDATGVYQLSVTCSDLLPDDMDIAVFTGETWEDTTSYAPEVPLIIEIDGVASDPLNARFENFSGEVAVVVTAAEEERVNEVIMALRSARQSVSASFFTTSATFGVDGIGESLASFLDRCDQYW
jgi:hypothetical protein